MRRRDEITDNGGNAETAGLARRGREEDTLAQRGKSRKKKPERWNDPPRRGNPFGLLLILVGAGGLLYAACAPKVKHAVETRPERTAQAAPTVPRARYEAPRRVAAPPAPVHKKRHEQRDEQPEPSRDDHRERSAPLAGADGEPTPKVIEEPAVVLAPQSEKEPEKPSRVVETEPPAPRHRKAAPTPKPAPAIVSVPKPAPLRNSRSTAVISAAEFSRNPGASGEVALTFDSCYDDRPLSDILAALDHHGYHATFFVAGIFADKFPNSVKRIADAGMEIGNHSWNHPAFTKLSNAEIDRQLTRTNDLITKITGDKPTLFRPPFGARDKRVRQQVADDGFHTVYWALDSWDSVKKGITPKEISDRVLSRVKPGDVVLLHVGSRATADALPEILRGLDSRGLRVVPVSRLMAGE